MTQITISPARSSICKQIIETGTTGCRFSVVLKICTETEIDEIVVIATEVVHKNIVIFQAIWSKAAANAVTLLWRHNGRDDVSNHQPHECLLNRSSRRRSKKSSKLRVTGPCAGKSPETGDSSHKWRVTQKMFPFDGVIMKMINFGCSQLPNFFNHSSLSATEVVVWTTFCAVNVFRVVAAKTDKFQ